MSESLSGSQHTIRREYGLSGVLSELTNNSRRFSFGNDQAGRLETVSLDSQPVLGYSYLAGVEPKTVTYGAAKETRSYDGRGRLVQQQQLGSELALNYAFGSDGNNRQVRVTQGGKSDALLFGSMTSDE